MPVAVYVGSTAGYSGKNLIAMSLGLAFQEAGLKVGYMKPVGAVPRTDGDVLGDEDAHFVSKVLGLEADPAKVTPVVVTRDFTVEAFTTGCKGRMEAITSAYEELSAGTDVMVVGGSGNFISSGTYCGLDGPAVCRALGAKVLMVDRFKGELKYDSVLLGKKIMGDDYLGVVFNDLPEHFRAEAEDLIIPFLEKSGIPVLGVIPSDPVLGAIKVEDLAQRLGGKIVSAHGQTDRVVENFLIGTMQVENFMTHFRKHKNSAVIVGGDRSDVQLVALEGSCPCLILTGNLYPNDIILTRSEVLETPIIMVREDTYTVAKKMESILSRHKLRDMIKVTHGARLVSERLDLERLKGALGL